MGYQIKVAQTADLTWPRNSLLLLTINSCNVLI